MMHMSSSSLCVWCRHLHQLLDLPIRVPRLVPMMMETCAADPATGVLTSVETVEDMDAARQAQLITGSHSPPPNLMDLAYSPVCLAATWVPQSLSCTCLRTVGWQHTPVLWLAWVAMSVTSLPALPAQLWCVKQAQPAVLQSINKSLTS